ncbi:pimeloyl-ACP methyl ester carboxylesterase [Rhodococcus sp. 27YEA15]|uniref:alpha/beta fold hydrolase n=1 Tax=Rhodococcus sp. 27YEA15 TaxID=3156259 RepID=UPI003C7C5036
MIVSDFDDRYEKVLAKWPAATAGVDIDGRFGTTHLNVCGATDAPPILLLPGGGATSTVWFDNVATLSKSHRVCAVDILGDAGRSVPGSERMRSLADLVEWVGSLVHYTGSEKIDVLAHSYGAKIALAYAVANPDRVRTLILLDPTACFAGMKFGYLLRAVPLLLAPTPARQRRLVTWEADSRALDEDWFTLLELGASTRRKLVVPPRPSAAQLTTLRAQTLVVLAEQSRVHDVDAVADVVHESIPHAQVVTVPNSSHHSLPMVPAGRLNRILDDFLQDQAPLGR